MCELLVTSQVERDENGPPSCARRLFSQRGVASDALAKEMWNADANVKCEKGQKREGRWYLMDTPPSVL